MLRLRSGLGSALPALCGGKKPAPQKTRRRPWLKIDMIALARDLRDWPGAYHYERAARLRVSARGVCDALKRLGVTYKNPCVTRRQTPKSGLFFKRKLKRLKRPGTPLFI